MNKSLNNTEAQDKLYQATQALRCVRDLCAEHGGDVRLNASELCTLLDLILDNIPHSGL